MSAAIKPTFKIIRPTDTYHGKQGLDYFAGISAESAGAEHICMHLLTIPPRGKAKAHRHEHHETAIYQISGESEVWYGENLSEHAIVHQGEFVYIPAGCPHLPTNPSDTVPCHVVIARTDPHEQESVILMPELDQHAHS